MDVYIPDIGEIVVIDNHSSPLLCGRIGKIVGIRNKRLLLSLYAAESGFIAQHLESISHVYILDASRDRNQYPETSDYLSENSESLSDMMLDEDIDFVFEDPVQESEQARISLPTLLALSHLRDEVLDKSKEGRVSLSEMNVSKTLNSFLSESYSSSEFLEALRKWLEIFRCLQVGNCRNITLLLRIGLMLLNSIIKTGIFEVSDTGFEINIHVIGWYDIATASSIFRDTWILLGDIFAHANSEIGHNDNGYFTSFTVARFFADKLNITVS